jgi:predicted Rossmann fold flavoprotein
LNFNYDVIIIGAGAAGLMCAIEAGKRGRRVCVIDHSKKAAEKVRISGGGRSNFTNMYASPNNFISANPHFCKSALSRYTQYDFMALMDKHAIAYHEKKLGQLFCDNSAQDLIDMLLNECDKNNVTVSLSTTIDKVNKTTDTYELSTSSGKMNSKSLIIACGGLSIPKIGASGFGYDIAKQFGHTIIDTRAGLVPLTFQNEILNMCKNLSGLSAEARVYAQDKTSFAEGLLFTHRGLSGPSILQISSYWDEGESIVVNLLPTIDVLELLKNNRDENPKQDIQNILSSYLPKRLVIAICDNVNVHGRLADLSNKALEFIATHINEWNVTPNGSEGYRTAEVTLGGVNTNELSSKTMESKLSDGLYFIGEVVDVTGHLGGFNFQWAWSSGWACGQFA